MNANEIQFLSDPCREGDPSTAGFRGMGADILRAAWPPLVGSVALKGCRTCRKPLDCRRAAHVEVKTTVAPGDPEIVFLAMLCTDCFDRGFAPRIAEDGDLRSIVAETAGLPLWAPPAGTQPLPLLPTVNPGEQPLGTVRVTVEIIDGRVVMGGAA